MTDRVLRCDGCGCHSATVVRVTDHVAFCVGCLKRYKAVKA